VLLADEAHERRFPLGDFVGRDLVEVPLGRRKDHRDLLFDELRTELRLLERFGDLLTARQLLLGVLVEVARELGERREFAVLREVELERPRDRAHRFDLR
jgi:hypothetical protein